MADSTHVKVKWLHTQHQFQSTCSEITFTILNWFSTPQKQC